MGAGLCLGFWKLPLPFCFAEAPEGWEKDNSFVLALVVLCGKFTYWRLLTRQSGSQGSQGPAPSAASHIRQPFSPKLFTTLPLVPIPSLGDATLLGFNLSLLYPQHKPPFPLALQTIHLNYPCSCTPEIVIFWPHLESKWIKLDNIDWLRTLSIRCSTTQQYQVCWLNKRSQEYMFLGEFFQTSKVGDHLKIF